MEPLIPNTSSTRCGSPVSSNCVIWQGKTISCIPDCNGDTISDVAYKLGQQLCYVQTLFDVSTIDLSCFYTPCPSCQEPTKLLDVLQTMVNYICTLKSTINQINTAIAQLGGVPPANV